MFLSLGISTYCFPFAIFTIYISQVYLISLFCSSFLHMWCRPDFTQVLLWLRTFLARIPQTVLLSCSAPFLPILLFSLCDAVGISCRSYFVQRHFWTGFPSLLYFPFLHFKNILMVCNTCIDLIQLLQSSSIIGQIVCTTSYSQLLYF